MRYKNLLFGDIRFQIKYGFYFIYLILCIFYICLLFLFPESWRKTAASLMVFSDPAAMGLFFMGAIVLYEKSERVLNALAVSPVRVSDYILSKIVSLAMISIIVAAALLVVAGGENIPLSLIGTVLTSIIFTLLGLAAAANINSLNQFMLVTIPIELICFGPVLLSLFQIQGQFLYWYPTNIFYRLVSGTANSLMPDLVITLLLIALLFRITVTQTTKMWASAAGIKV